jgi:hypothetical protein
MWGDCGGPGRGTRPRRRACSSCGAPSTTRGRRHEPPPSTEGRPRHARDGCGERYRHGCEGRDAPLSHRPNRPPPEFPTACPATADPRRAGGRCDDSAVPRHALTHRATTASTPPAVVRSGSDDPREYGGGASRPRHRRRPPTGAELGERRQIATAAFWEAGRYLGLRWCDSAESHLRPGGGHARRRGSGGALHAIGSLTADPVCLRSSARACHPADEARHGPGPSRSRRPPPMGAAYGARGPRPGG